MNIHSSVTDLIGNTPLIKLANYSKLYNLHTPIIGKLESFNPAGSVKDRIAYSMISDAENKGLINKDTVLIEPTSGNTGIGLAAVAASRGYKLILTMPKTMSVERRQLLAAYGAELVLTDNIADAVTKADELANEYPNSFIPGQFTNPVNPATHENTTGTEIWNDTDGKIDIFIAGVGSGGTISGVGAYLKRMNPNIKVIAVEPADSPFLSQGKAGPHKLQGIGAGFCPCNLNTAIYDEIVTVTADDAYLTSKEIARNEGILVGITSGAAVWTARKIAVQTGNNNKTIVAFLPDSGERYMSSGLFD